VPVALAAATEGWARPLTPSDACPIQEVITFPLGGVERTRWDICWEAVEGPGLVIRYAAFRPSPSAPAVQVLGDARLAEIFVPYHPGTPRPFDFDFSLPLQTLGAADCPAPQGTLVGDPAVACRELRDRGLAWKNFGQVRRGEEIVLWAVVLAVNYNYVVEWSFHDDGTGVGRAGSTGPKLGGGTDSRGHMHNFTWRLDVDLGGPDLDSVRTTKHSEPLPGTTATDSSTRLQKDQGVGWRPRQFTSLEITDATLTNAGGHPVSYELIPLRSGTSRHEEAFTKKDFWVTRYNPDEWRGKNLPQYADGESVVDTDVVVWYTGSTHHESGVRDEERDTVPVKWIGFQLVPINVSTRTPFFPP
jgi:primary-amine oxidase